MIVCREQGEQLCHSAGTVSYSEFAQNFVEDSGLHKKVAYLNEVT